MSVTQAKTLPERIVPRQEEKADKVTRGPRITMPIPTKKITGRICFETRYNGSNRFVCLGAF